MVRRLFLTPDETPAETYGRCLAIPANRAWLAAVNQALLILTNPANWEQLDETDITPEAAAEAAYEMYVAYLSAECGADMNCQDVYDCLSPYAALPASALKRVNAGIPQVSFDGGTTWTDLEDPGTDGSPRVPSRVATEGEDKTCLAATRAMMTIAELYRQTAGAVAADLTNTLNEIINLMDALNTALFQMIYSPYDGILEAAIFDPLDMPTNFADGELDQTAKDAILCLLLANATDDGSGIVSFDFQAVYDNVIAELGLNPGTAVTLLLGYIGEIGLNRAGDVHITDTADCAYCEGAWCYLFDFDNGEQGWYADPSGVYTGSSYWYPTQPTYAGPPAYMRSWLQIRRDFAERTITRVEIVYTNKTEGTFSGSLQLDTFSLVLAGMNELLVSMPTTPRVPPSPIIWTGSVSTNYVEVMATLSAISPTGWDGDIRIQSIRLEGTGTNPFGTDNCP